MKALLRLQLSSALQLQLHGASLPHSAMPPQALDFARGCLHAAGALPSTAAGRLGGEPFAASGLNTAPACFAGLGGGRDEGLAAGLAFSSGRLRPAPLVAAVSEDHTSWQVASRTWMGQRMQA